MDKTEELYRAHLRALPLDKLVQECGIVSMKMKERQYFWHPFILVAAKCIADELEHRDTEKNKANRASGASSRACVCGSPMMNI